MVQAIPIENRIQELLANDPLFQLIQYTPTEQLFISEPYLHELIEKRYYSTPEVARWFDVTEARLRYYIKPFEAYLFDEHTTSTNRLDFLAILKLRMILLLKDEYRVRGLKQLLRMNKDGHVIKQIAATDSLPGTMQDKRITILSEAFTQIMQTGLFHIEQGEDADEMKIRINEAFLQQQFNSSPSESAKEIKALQSLTEQLEQKNQELTEKIEEILLVEKQDIAISIRENHFQQSILKRLEMEASVQYDATKKPSLFRKIFHYAQIEKEKKEYIATYVDVNFHQQLKEAFEQYYE